MPPAKKGPLMVNGRLIAALVAVPLLLIAVGALRAGAVEPGNEHFQRTWERTDQPVAEGVESRTWMWGPEAFSTLGVEPYAEAPNGQRTVQYFDKSRMEITNPAGDPNSIWYVTNGLLVVEMMTGRLQLGDNTFETRNPAVVNVAGDANDPNGPTYAGMASLRDAPPLGAGATVTQRVSRAGAVTFDGDLAQYGVTVAKLDEVTNHSIAGPFWNFMNSSGTVWANGQYVTDLLFANPYFATGRPITEPYWALVQVGGVEREVLIQCFERRCLTYTPGNSPGFITEAGNVGQHYFAWRYGDDGDPPTAEPTGTVTASPSASPSGTETASPTSTSPATETATVEPSPSATVEPENPFAHIETCGGPVTPNRPAGVAIAPDGSVYLADTDNDQIIKLDSNGSRVATWGSRGGGDGEFRSPRGIEVNATGDVYVADFFNDRIQVFNSNGSHIRTWGAEGSGDGEFDGPADIALAGNLVFVTDQRNDRVQVFTTQGQYLREWGGEGSGDGQFNAPIGIAASSNNTIYVADRDNDRVQYFGVDGGFLGKFGGFGGGDGQFFEPTGIAVDPDLGYVYVADSSRGNIQVFNALGGFLLEFGTIGSDIGEFIWPIAVATDGTDNVWVADEGAMRVQQWAAEGQEVVYQREWRENQDGYFAVPDDVVVDANGFIFVVDQLTNFITKFEPDCSFDRSWGGYGFGNAEYASPVAAAISPDNLIYVADRNNDRIQVTSNIGTFVREWGEFGSDAGDLNFPSDLAFGPNGDVYVSDFENHRIQVFSNVGVYKFEWGAEGTGQGQFDGPRHIAIANNQVYVGDRQRVQIFDLAGVYVGQLNPPPDTEWFFVNDVAADGAGNVYVNVNSRLYVYDAQDDFIGDYRLEDASGNVIGGDGMAFGPNGDLYIVDTFRIGLYRFDVDLPS